MGPINDPTVGAIEFALRGLAQRSEVSANNVANLNTPGFRASQVDFESALRGALSSGRLPGGAAPGTMEPGTGLPDATGNTVDLETEMVTMIKDNLLRDSLVNAFNTKAGLLRTAITGA